MTIRDNKTKGKVTKDANRNNEIRKTKERCIKQEEKDPRTISNLYMGVLSTQPLH